MRAATVWSVGSVELVSFPAFENHNARNAGELVVGCVLFIPDRVEIDLKMTCYTRKGLVSFVCYLFIPEGG